MALDGAFLRHLKREIEENALGSRIDKIYQPARDELVFSLRRKDGSRRLMVSARADSARIHFTKIIPENPKQPPMLCMLLRKRLTGARLRAVRQPGLERLLCLDFETVSELGDPVLLTLIVEVMGRYSNAILVGSDGKIIDALRRVDASMSSERLILPGVAYRFPPPQNKLCLLTADRREIIARVRAMPAGTGLAKALLAALQGLSPVVCRELQHLTGRGQELRVGGMTPEQFDRLSFFLSRLAETVKNADGAPYLAADLSRKPLDFSFFPITYYGTAAVVTRKDGFSQLLDDFYGERDRLARIHTRSLDLLRVLTTASDRLSRRIGAQQADLKRCTRRDRLRIFGDLLNANLYRLKKGPASVTLPDFYREGQPPVAIPLDPLLTPAQNAQKYYKEYRKAKTAEKVLSVQIWKTQRELSYLETVFDELSRASGERDLDEIRAELTEQGYLRRPREGKKDRRGGGGQPPLEFRSSDGLPILAGRNNRQNDFLTLKQAKKNDLWFHTKNIPGSHVILVLHGKKPTPAAISEAAQVAAYHSRGRGSSNVAVDYTPVRFVSKPQGAKPGMVIYVGNKTVFASPDRAAVEKLKVSR